MRLLPSFFNTVVACVLVPASLACAANGSAVRPVTPSIPLLFQQVPAQDAFLASSRGAQVLIRPHGADILVSRVSAISKAGGDRASVCTSQSTEVRQIRMTLANASGRAALNGLAPSTAKLNYLTGDSSECRTDLKTWLSVKVANVYDGIDLVYYGNDQSLEYDFHVAPGRSPSKILMDFAGADSIRIDSNGDLVLKAGLSEVRQHRPVIYQEIDGKRVRVDGSYRLASASSVGFVADAYRKDLPLVIDPVLSYSTYFGGSAGDISLAVRLGPAGSIFIAGQTLSTGFPFSRPAGAFQSKYRGGTYNGDAYVARFAASGALEYFTYIGGTADDGAFDLAVDAEGNAYVTGFTTSPNFPVRAAFSPRIHGKPNPELGTYAKDAFVCKLNPSGSALVYSTFLGGTSPDIGTAIALAPDGSACVTGTTVSTNFPVLNPIPGHSRKGGATDAFVTKIAPDGASLIFSSYLGGNRTDSGQGIATDGVGAVYLTGYTASPNFPILNAFQPNLNTLSNYNGACDAYIAKLDAAGGMLYSTFLGSRANEIGYRVAVDGSGNAYVTGYTQSELFPNTLTNVPGLKNARSAFANADAFLSKISVDEAGLTSLAYSAVFGGLGSDVGWDLAVTPAGDAYVIGVTSSRGFPTNNTGSFLRNTNSGANDVFVTALSADATHLLYSGYIGGSQSDYGYGIALDYANNAYLTGRTVSANFPVVSGFQTRRYGPNDAFLAILSPDAAAVPTGSSYSTISVIGPGQ